MNFRQIMNELSATYLVSDVNIESASIIFILESPHVQEVKHGVPVAGASGATMTKQLLSTEQKVPLGLLLKSDREREGEQNLSNVGLMNICQLPMQRSAYDAGDIQGYDSFFHILEGIRTANHKKTFKDEQWNELQQLISAHFHKRLKPLEDRAITFVPCGRFAQKFFEISLEDVDASNWTIIEDVPHPSYNSWSRERYEPVISHVKSAFDDSVD